MAEVVYEMCSHDMHRASDSHSLSITSVKSTRTIALSALSIRSRGSGCVDTASIGSQEVPRLGNRSGIMGNGILGE